MDAVMSLKVNSPDFYGIEIRTSGERFLVKSTGAGVIRLERKADKLGFRFGNQAQKVLVVKEKEINTPTAIRIYCIPNGSYAGKSEAFLRSIDINSKAVNDELFPQRVRPNCFAGSC